MHWLQRYNIANGSQLLGSANQTATRCIYDFGMEDYYYTQWGFPIFLPIPIPIPDTINSYATSAAVHL